MSCLVDYVLNFGGQSFSEKPFNEVDNLIFSLLSYFNFAGKVTGTDSPKKKVTLFDVLYNNSDATVYKDIFNQERIKELIPLLIISRRFGRVELCCYSSETDEEKQVQFSATTFILDDNSVYVAFRGTDMSFVGWKEDFNMSFIYPVPAQIQAQSYLELIARSYKQKLRVGGHSKGGNLAVYAAAGVSKSVKRRITAVYDNDGPGFTEEFFSTSGYEEIKEKVIKLVPHYSVVGMLFYNSQKYTIVDSDGVWLLQHDPLSWKVEGDSFVKMQEINVKTQLMNESLNKWIEQMPTDERTQFVDTLFSVLSASNAESFDKLLENRKETASGIISAIKKLDPKVRSGMLQAISELIIIATKNYTDDKKQKISLLIKEITKSSEEFLKIRRKH